MQCKGTKRSNIIVRLLFAEWVGQLSFLDRNQVSLMKPNIYTWNDNLEDNVASVFMCPDHYNYSNVSWYE